MSQYHPHPLLLPNIVSAIFSHFDDIPTLQSFRQVCHCWNEEVCSSLRRLKPIQFCNYYSLQRYNEIFQNSYEILGTFPHNEYHIFLRLERKAKSDEELVESLELKGLPEVVEQFLDYFGDQISSLHLCVGHGYLKPRQLDQFLSRVPNINVLGLFFRYNIHSEVAHEISSESILHLSNVHTLVIQIEGQELGEESITGLLSFLFPFMPNLRKISYPGDIRRISKVGLLLRDIILDSETSVQLKKLCEFEFKTRLLEDDALKLLCKDFPFKTLHFDLFSPDSEGNVVSPDLMAGLLLKWNETLQTLVLEFPWRDDISYRFRFPTVMQNLTFLFLGGFEGILMELLRCLPNLRRLEISQTELLCIIQKPEATDVYPNVKQLRLDFCVGQSAGILSRFSRMFPGLRSLNINHATNEVARGIFQKMPHLLSLRLQGNDLTDAGMCGFSETTVKEKDFLAMSPYRSRDFRKYPYIADLKELQYLKLDGYSLTEITVRHGLMHCHSLRLVKLDCTANTFNPSTTIRRTFRLSDLSHFVQEGKHALVEMKEEPPLEAEALAFFQSHLKHTEDI
ncbi:unnamed protein product [Orchesella dallaii]|uniref:F-box domain-containing protein n=1 Tax=Orchesella dallaii TaxID=48710 RepID=A0ABP1QM21_9HEXA